MIGRTKLVFSEALRSIGANLSTTFASALSVLIGMFLVGVFIGLGTWLVSWADEKKRELTVHVFIHDEATTKQINALRISLESDTRVKEGGVTFISKAQALRIMQKRAPELTENLVSNPLPASFDVVPKRGEDTEEIAAAVRQSELAAVEEVRSGQEVSQRILAIARAIQIVFLIVVIVLLAASTILIANTIRLSIFARRREIEVMKLVGATDWFIRWPFIIEGLIVGFLGAASAVAVLLLGKVTIVDPLSERFALVDNLNTIDFVPLVGVLVACAMAVSALGSGVTLRRFLRV